MSGNLITFIFLVYLSLSALALEAVLIPKKAGENIYVKKYYLSKDRIDYTDCNDGASSRFSEDYIIMNDDSACLAVSFGKQMEMISLALKTTIETPEISNLVVEYRKLELSGFKNMEEILLSYKNTPYWKVGQIKEGNRFNLIFYINEGKGCKYRDSTSLREKLIKLGFSENYFKLIKNRGSKGCSDKVSPLR